jgi:hypothetical protein
MVLLMGEDLKHKLSKLKEEHRGLDDEITRRMATPLYDQLAVQRLKKRKLKLKDEINKVKAKLIPDIIA